jgi:hypothetical protein
MGWGVARMEEIKNPYGILIIKPLLKRLNVRSRGDETITLRCAIRKECRWSMGPAEGEGLL